MGFWANFWDVIGWFLWAFIFIAYLMALFTIIVDVFRDRKLAGWAKALWVVALIFFPFITAVVYLIARGGGIAERQAAEAGNARAAAEAYVREVAGSSPSDEIAKAKRLLDGGTITVEEYEALKAKALALPTNS